MSDMQKQNSDGVRSFVDSTLAIAFARFGMPIALAIIGYFMTSTLTELKTDIKAATHSMWESVAAINNKLSSQAAEVATIKADVTNQSRNLDRLSTKVDTLKN